MTAVLFIPLGAALFFAGFLAGYAGKSKRTGGVRKASAEITAFDDIRKFLQFDGSDWKTT